jgi:hypothetical protein
MPAEAKCSDCGAALPSVEIPMGKKRTFLAAGKNPLPDIINSADYKCWLKSSAFRSPTAAF